MRKLAGTLLGIGLMLGAAGCGVDKEGTADNLIKTIEDAAGQELTDEQKTCLTDLVKSFSDDELEQLDKNEASDELQQEFTDGTVNCLADLGS